MGKLVTLGIASVKMGNIAEDGSMGTSLTTIGDIEEGTFQMIQEDDTETQIRAEEYDDPAEVVTVDGAKRIEFNLLNPDAEGLARVFGGSATGTPKKFAAPASSVTLEQSVEVNFKKGFDKFQAARVRVKASFGGSPSKTTPFTVKISMTILQPTKVGEPAFAFIERGS